MPINDLTTNRSYKLPNAANFLADDVQRLRDALAAIDADVFARYTKTETDQKLADLINGAPGALNTLNELAAAMGNDPNFATTITNALAGKPGFADVWTRTQADARYVQGVTQTENTFTGTGSQTTFALTQTPPSRESLLVTVDGVVQPTTEYTLSGSALLLSEAPASGARIRVLMLGVAGPVQSASTLSFTQAGTAAVTQTVDSKLKEIVSVRDFGAVGDGTTDDTAAINAAITYVAGLTYGGAVFFPVGAYAVTEINASLINTGFNKTVRLFGLGRNMSRIVPKQAGGVLLNMMGSNQMLVENLHFDSTAFVSQCAIFLARTTVSGNCNNNKFTGLFFTGSYSKATVVSNGSESSNWFNCRMDNVNASASYRCFWAGGGSSVGGLQAITTVNGGTVSSSNNPATDNKMFGCEFYAPYTGAQLVRFSESASYTFVGCTIIGGSANNVRLVTYGDPGGGRFNGPISWESCHFEVFGTGNTVHYLNGSGAQVTFDGINSYGGYYVLSNNTAVIDFNRTVVAEQPILATSTWTTPSTSPNSTGTNAYVYALYNSSFSLKPNATDGGLYLTGFINANSVVDVNYFFPGATRYVNSQHSSVATALPTTGSYTVGETIWRETPAVGQPIGWKCTASGTLGTLSGTTGSITNGTNTLVVNTAAGLAEGQRINVTGAGGPFYIRKLSGTTAYLDTNATATVSGAAVSFSNATLVAMANL